MSGLSIVTGGGGGIGREVCVRLAARGDLVAVWDVDLTQAEQTVSAVQLAGGQAEAHEVDVTNPAAVRAAVAGSVERHGPIRVLVAGAGHWERTPFLEMPLESWQRMLDVHATGAFLCAQAAAESMSEAGYGRMVLISSLAGVSGNAGSVHYAAAKAAMIGFGKALARELGPRGISVNLIAPGAIDTPMLQAVTPEIRARNIDNPAGRVGLPSDIARTVQFLTEPDSDFITGQLINVNGGAYI